MPVKGLKDAKRRLEGLLRPEEKYQLCFVMLRDVLKAVRTSRYVGQVAVISCDQKVLELASKIGAIGFDEGVSRGLNSAIEHMANFCIDRGAESILVLPIDVPLVKTADIDGIIRKSRLPKSIVIVPSMDEKGTNALLMRPPTAIKPRFGLDSFRAHISEAKLNKIPLKISKLPRIALDIDMPKDLALFLKMGKGTETYSFMVEIGLVDRVREYLERSYKPIP
ncbi:MAG: 2-phospho-L-lactate guanylyltransferase [Candidatus Methylarchaceae archaeon HK02M1]|nr:2-phospho-L-lactate guanylyltransferase [Candidatus Methylarchaceae archaeon HK02M1]